MAIGKIKRSSQLAGESENRKFEVLEMDEFGQVREALLEGKNGVLEEQPAKTDGFELCRLSWILPETQAMSTGIFTGIENDRVCL